MSLNLKSRKQGIHIFSAGFFTFKPLKQPNLCNQKPSIIQNTKFHDSLKSLFPPNIDPSFPPPLQDPNTSSPSVGGLPLLPKLPTLPPILGIQIPPLLPTDEKVVNPQNLPTFSPIPFFPPPIVPNPLQPPPLVSNPLQPPSPNPLQPPNPFQPPKPFQPPSPTPLIPNPFQPPPPPPPLFTLPPLFPPPRTPPSSSSSTKNGSP
ncbi:hypothetical protein Lal_00023653 [Lupinus albus]|nr:hypothetical protein Lal_00023653 [Lupinus albus]